jgi:hypothetical protein
MDIRTVFRRDMAITWVRSLPSRPAYYGLMAKHLGHDLLGFLKDTSFEDTCCMELRNCLHSYAVHLRHAASSKQTILLGLLHILIPLLLPVIPRFEHHNFEYAYTLAEI